MMCGKRENSGVEIRTVLIKLIKVDSVYL